MADGKRDVRIQSTKVSAVRQRFAETGQLSAAPITALCVYLRKQILQHKVLVRKSHLRSVDILYLSTMRKYLEDKCE